MADKLAELISSIRKKESEKVDRDIDAQLKEKARMLPSEPEAGLEEGDLSDYYFPVRGAVRNVVKEGLPVAKEVAKGLVTKPIGRNPMAGKVKGIGGTYKYEGARDLGKIADLEKKSLTAAQKKDYELYKQILEDLRREKSPKKVE